MLSVNLCITGVTKLNVESSEYQNNIQNAVINGAAGGINISEQKNEGEESTMPAEKKEFAVEHLTRDLETIGLNKKVKSEIVDCSDENMDLVRTSGENDSNLSMTSNEKKESALEHLAKNLESTGKYQELTGQQSDNIKPNDIIAFKVFGPDLKGKLSDYIIAMVEDVKKKHDDDVDQLDYDLILSIMGNNK